MWHQTVQFLMNTKLEWIWKEAIMAQVDAIPVILLEGLREIMKPETRVACLPAEI